MEPQSERNNPIAQERERVFPGILGAFLFSLAGAVVYLILHRVGYIAGITGLATAYLSFFGYGLLSGNKESKKGMIVAAVFALGITVVSCWIAFAWELYALAKADSFYIPLSRLIPDTLTLLKNGQITYRSIPYIVDPANFYKDLLTALAFCALGIFGLIRSIRMKKHNDTQEGRQT